MMKNVIAIVHVMDVLEAISLLKYWDSLGHTGHRGRSLLPIEYEWDWDGDVRYALYSDGTVIDGFTPDKSEVTFDKYMETITV